MCDVDPGFPVEDLEEELDEMWSAIDEQDYHYGAGPSRRAIELRRARLAAQRPEYQEGDEVQVRGKYLGTGEVLLNGSQGDIVVRVDRDDIRPAENDQ